MTKKMNFCDAPESYCYSYWSDPRPVLSRRTEPYMKNQSEPHMKNQSGLSSRTQHASVKRCTLSKIFRRVG
ncbi:unnamed protein product [Amoebophrya sp. A120]|nr:unnamed protein product [Amoebophrya sp. A120]|eukprot:GSA120T00009759001.1